jgi:hypothetical protein
VTKLAQPVLVDNSCQVPVPNLLDAFNIEQTIAILDANCCRPRPCMIAFLHLTSAPFLGTLPKINALTVYAVRIPIKSTLFRRLSRTAVTTTIVTIRVLDYSPPFRLLQRLQTRLLFLRMILLVSEKRCRHLSNICRFVCCHRQKPLSPPTNFRHNLLPVDVFQESAS